MAATDNSRRRFLRCCGSALALAGAYRAACAQSGHSAPYPKVCLRWSDGRPVTPESLEVEQEYLYFYPYQCTPCFLLRLGRPTARGLRVVTDAGARYRWTGGIGPNGDLVSFSAICSHKLSYPAPAVSFIGYRRQPVAFRDARNRVVRRAGVIQCCSEHSVYDPASGAKVLSGPAPAPLAAVALASGPEGLQAQGIYGEDVFGRFLDRFGYQLALTFGDPDYRRSVTDSATVVRSEDYSRRRIQCS